MRVLGLAFLLCLLNAGAAIPQAPTAATAIAAAAALFAEQQPAAVADAPEKAISRTDKMTVDLTGTVIGAYLPADICHTGDTAILYLRVKGVPVAIACLALPSQLAWLSRLASVCARLGRSRLHQTLATQPSIPAIQILGSPVALTFFS